MKTRSLVKAVIPRGLFRRVEPYGHLGEAVVLNAKNGSPARGMRFIGVTGTDGKTTTCFLIHQMLKSSGYKVAMLTTAAVDYADGVGKHPSPTHMTTPDVSALHKAFKKIKAQKPDWVVMETSSHALAQHRVLGVPYSVAVLTNITHEHLDYHGTMKKYRQAKLKLFKLTDKNNQGLRTGVINADDPAANMFKKSITNPITYGVNSGDLKAEHIKTTPKNNSFKVKMQNTELNLTVSLPGKFNIYNALAAAGVGLAIGLHPQQIEKGIASLKQVPGRMTRVEAGQPFEVLVDYAVTPSALKNVLRAAHEVKKGKVIIVFGATGDRDKTKRPEMGEVVARNADRVFLTDDETYTEDPQAIRRAVYEGIKNAGGESKTTEVEDREQAIMQAISEARTEDVILITGLGHQKDRNMGGKLMPWSDIEVARSLIKKINEKS
ncbi:MAG TPA: UDP-N-acetylmuramoyl-L-alanyl-D-glutamate--2,6-diaminopimelate ligase [Candidatus Saccharimonadales bacterium]|nr:UDP-N-acetylmuramoyl-L-alanyl-D-glutamate--2,6-diaminopimelate ligase [Candidatus Saccharimonadales bacterium]